MSTHLPDHLPSAGQPDLFERPLADAAADEDVNLSTLTQVTAPTCQAALPPAYRHGHGPGYPQPYTAARPHTTTPTPPHVHTSQRSTYPKVYT